MKQTLGRYQIETPLGSGAYADVYKATDLTLKRTVALKVLKPALLSDEEAFARFVQEAQTAAGLFHPSIATVLDLGEAEGRHFLAMRFVDGVSLEELIAAKGALPWTEALRIAEQVASALDFAHTRGLVHRDVKPTNILVSPTEGAVLTDFGLVRALESGGVGTRTGSLLGTPQYIPPEVWKGKPASPASDQYALACVLVEMLTGKVLYDGPTPWAVMAKHAASPELPAKWPEDSPTELDIALKKALAQEPGERFESCRRFVEAISPSTALNRVEVVPAEKTPGETEKPVEKIDEMSITLAPGVEMVFVRVPAGEFWMGSSDFAEDARGNEKPNHVVFLEDYWIGKFPVTNAQYGFFNMATKNNPKWKYKQSQGNYPAVNVSWYDSNNFCKWASQTYGKLIRLPSEAEWEKAARGIDQRTYPWGNKPPNRETCYYDKFIGGPTYVGRYSPQGDSPYGSADMSGNVWEWTSSHYFSFPYRSNDGREDQADEGTRVVRGGAWDCRPDLLRVAVRFRYLPIRQLNSLGFRCSLSP